MAIGDEDKKTILDIFKEALAQDRAANAPKPRTGDEERRKTDRRKPAEPKKEPSFLDNLTGGGR